MNQTICFILAQEGDKDFPGKNLKELGGKPLICWITDSVLVSGIADVLWVATDCEQMETLINTRYGERVKVYGASRQRDGEEAPVMEVVKEFLDTLRPHDKDRFILLQTVSPFIRIKDLQTLQTEMEKGEYDSFISCCRVKKRLWDSNGRPLNDSLRNKPAKHVQEGVLLESEVFYASTVGQIRKTGSLVSGRVKMMETDKSGLIDMQDKENEDRAEEYIRTVGISNDFYLEFYEAVEAILKQYVAEKGWEPFVKTYLFQNSFRLRDVYNDLRKKGRPAPECLDYLKQGLLPPNRKERPYAACAESSDYKLEFWYQYLLARAGRLIVYIYNNRQLNYLLPLINALNRPLLLICEREVDMEVETTENVEAIEMCFWNELNVYDDGALKEVFPELYKYYNAFSLMFEALDPEGVLVLEGCHYQEQILSAVAGKKGVPSVAVQQGWPSFIHTMFRDLPYSYYLTWGTYLNKEWSKYNSRPEFIPTGYIYPVKEKKKHHSITFFLQSPVFLSDHYYFAILVELIGETARRYPDIPVWVREHPEYKLDPSVINTWSKYTNIRMASNLSLPDVFACTQIVVSHYSSVLVEGLAHDCIPLVFDPTLYSRYTPDIEELKVGRIAHDKRSFFENLEYIQENISFFRGHLLKEKDKWFTAVSKDAIRKTVNTIHRKVKCNYLETTSIPCLHIGCGPFLLEGWLNTDIVNDIPGVYYLDAGKDYPFPDGSFDYIYSEHLFEHLEVKQGMNMLCECHRILKPGGRIRLAMPDFHFLMDLYLHPEKESNRRYLNWSYQNYIAQKTFPEINKEHLPVYVINNFFHSWGHLFIHTPEDLKEMAAKAGFGNFRSYPVGKSDTPVFEAIENHHKDIPEWANELETFIIEMEKIDK